MSARLVQHGRLSFPFGLASALLAAAGHASIWSFGFLLVALAIPLAIIAVMDALPPRKAPRRLIIGVTLASVVLLVVAAEFVYAIIT